MNIFSIFGFDNEFASNQLVEEQEKLIELEEGNFKGNAKKISLPLTEEKTVKVAQHPPCEGACCVNQSFFKGVFLTPDNAVNPLLSRCVKKDPFVPQSYNFTDFENNQRIAIQQTSRRVTAEVIQEVFSKTLHDKGERLVTNAGTIVPCRFFPENKGLNPAEAKEAALNDTFLEGPLKASLIGSLLENANTVCGQEFLLVRAANPTNSIELIKKRQIAIQLLIGDTDLHAKLQTTMKTYGEFEDELSSRLHAKAAKLPGRIEAYLKFSLLDIPETTGKLLNEKIRESSTALTINNSIKTGQDAWGAILLPVVATASAAYAAERIFPGLFSSSTATFINSFTARYIGQSGALISAMQAIKEYNIDIFGASIGALSSAAKAIDVWGYFNADQKVKIVLQNKMVKVAKCIRSMKRAYELIKNNLELVKSLEHFDKLCNLIESKNPQVQKMLGAIVSRTLDEPSQSLYFCLGPVLVAWNLLLDKDVRNCVLEALVAMGEIDANIALARKVAESTEDQPFSLPDIVEEDEAIFQTTNAHFPPVSNESRDWAHKGNSIGLPSLAILTAENGAGKTTFALSWFNLLLSTQSLGIGACAPGTRISIFDNITTSMGVTDNNNESSQEAHERFARELVERLEKHPNEKTFVLLDELFKTTDQGKAARLLNDLADKLSHYPSKLKAVFITHSKDFARGSDIGAVKYTTRKVRVGGEMKPSGILEKGIYDFPGSSPSEF